MGFVFDVADEVRLAPAIVERLADYLKAGDLSHGLTGMDAMSFVLYVGADLGDPTVMDTPQLVYAGDENPSANFVRIEEVLLLEGPDDYDGKTERSRWRVVLDVQGNSDTAGVDADSDQARLASAVHMLVRHREAMREQGFHNPRARLGAPDLTAKQYKFPVTLEFWIYAATA